MKENDLIIRNSKLYVISTKYVIIKLIWQKKICCDNKSWKYFFYSAALYNWKTWDEYCVNIEALYRIEETNNNIPYLL